MNSKELAYSYKLAESKIRNQIVKYVTMNYDNFHRYILMGQFEIADVREEKIYINYIDENHKTVEVGFTYEQLESVSSL